MAEYGVRMWRQETHIKLWWWNLLDNNHLEG